MYQKQWHACQEIANHTEKDKTLSLIHNAIKTGDWRIPQIEPFAKINNELSTHKDGNIFFKRTWIIPPVSLEHRALEIVHTGHQGITKMQMLLLHERHGFPRWIQKLRSLFKIALLAKLLEKNSTITNG